MRSRSGWVRAKPLVRGAGVLALLVALSQTGARAEPEAAPIAGTCPHQHFAAAKKTVLDGALPAGRDVLGERLIASPGDPTYAAVRALLPPLWYALGRGGRPLTTTGSYYLTFAYPLEPLRREGVRAPRRRRERDHHAAHRRTEPHALRR